MSPRTALSVGLKVDVDALPRAVVSHLRAGRVNLDDPAVTLALLQADAVVGVKGVVEGGKLRSIGITLRLLPLDGRRLLRAGIGRRLDGWPNQDLNVGAIVGLRPTSRRSRTSSAGAHVDVATVRQVLASWGAGNTTRSCPRWQRAPPGRQGRGDGIPPAFGLAGVNLHTWTGWGSVPYWNAYVATTQLRGIGTFFDPRLNDPEKFPVAAGHGHGNVRPDRRTIDHAEARRAPLLPARDAGAGPPAGSFDPAAAASGKALSTAKAQCATCHVPPLFTEPGWNMHTPRLGIDDFQAQPLARRALPHRAARAGCGRT